MQLGSRSSDAKPPATAQLIPDHKAWWGKHEQRLKAPIPLLRWLVEHLEPSAGRESGSPRAQAYRRKLMRRDQATIALALKLLDGGKAPRWCILEGPSQPDAYLEAEDFVLVIEGKRTERGATTKTTWMRDRKQMLRHMDAARNARGEKRILGLMIVEAPAETWIKENAELRSPAVLERSLPHLTPQERADLADGFLGVTTWQDVCAKFSIPFPP